MLRDESSLHAHSGIDLDTYPSANGDASPDIITIPDTHLLFHGDFKRVGDDLKISEDGKSFVVHDYFKTDHHATLYSREGAQLTGDVVAALAGPLAPGQYAQAGGAPANDAAKPIGRVATVSGTAQAVRNGVAVTLNTGDSIQKGDVLQTMSDSAIGVIFTDGTTFNLSANARMVVDEFVYDPNGANNAASIKLVQGAISFLAGQVAKTGDMQVGTPVATMGIRGTAVNVTISADNGATQISVMAEADNLTHTVQVYSVNADGTRGALLGTVTNNTGIFQFNPSPVGVLVQEIGKDAATVQKELAIVQQVFQTQAVGQQFLQAPDQQGNTKTAQGPTGTQFIVSDHSKPGDVQTSSSGPITTKIGGDSGPNGGTQNTGDTHVNHAPVAANDQNATVESGVQPGNTAFAGTPVATGNVLSNDYDPDGDAVSVVDVVAVSAHLHGLLSLGADGKYTYTLDNNNPLTQQLAAGETATDVFRYKISDGAITTTATLAITITGTNDQPVIAADTVSQHDVTEGTGTNDPDSVKATTNGTLAFSDVDLSDTHTVSGAVLSSSSWAGGSIPADTLAALNLALTAAIFSGVAGEDSTGSGTGTLHWDFAIPEHLLDFLAQDETLTAIYTITITDNNGATATQDVKIVITGTNDTPNSHPVVISVDDTGTLQEGATLSDTGAITFLDVDQTDHITVTDDALTTANVTWSGGTLSAAHETALREGFSLDQDSFNNSGTVNWTYARSEGDLDFLAQGETATLEVTVKLTDSHGAVTSQVITITITGAEDAPVITAATTPADVTGAVTEDGTQSASGTITFQDVDLTDTHTLDQALFGGSIDGGALPGFNPATQPLGTLSLTLNEDNGDASDIGTVGWTFTIDNDLVQQLADGQVVTQTYRVTIADNHGGSTTQDVTVTITGTNDGPTIASSGSSGAVPDQIQHATSTGVALNSTNAVRGLATDGQYLYVDDSGQEIDVYTFNGTLVGSHSVDNLAGGNNQMTFADGHLYARNNDTIYLISTQDWSSTAVDIPQGNPLLTAHQWMSGDMLSLPDGRIGVLGANGDGTTTLRLYSVGSDGLSFTWNEDIVLQTNGAPYDEHGSASDGTYVYMVDYSNNNYRSYSLATGQLAYDSSGVFDLQDSGTGFDLDNPTFFTHDHVNGVYIVGSYGSPGVQFSGPSAGSAASQTGAVVEDGTQSASGTFNFRDIDLTDTHTLGQALFGGSIDGGALPGFDPATQPLGTLSLTLHENPADTIDTGSVDWTFTIDNDLAQQLADGQVVTQTYRVTIDDGHGGSTTQDVTVTITGTNDGPTITAATTPADVTGAVVEDGAQSTSGTITFQDIDLTDTHTLGQSLVDGSINSALPGFDPTQDTLGTLSLSLNEDNTDTTNTGTVGWTYTIDNAAAQKLADGQVVTQVYRVTIDDGHGGSITQDITVTITGTNDGPQVAVDATPLHTFTEQTTTNSNTTATVASGSLSFTDVDLTDSHSVSTSLASAQWDGGALSQGRLDDIANAIHAAVATDSTGSGAGSVNFSVTATGHDLDFLTAGSILTVVYNVTVSDGIATSTQQVTVKVTGTNDAPVLEPVSPTPNPEPELGNASAQAISQVGNLAVSDADVGDTLAAQIVSTAVKLNGNSFTLPAGAAALIAAGALTFGASQTSDGNTKIIGWTYHTDPANLDFLALGETLTIDYGVAIGDGHTTSNTQHLVFTITGSNDAPVVTGAVQGSATEDGSTSAINALANASDVDDGAVLSVINVPGVLPAGVTYNAGTHSFTLDPANAAYQHLAQDATTVVTVTYNVSDGITTTPASVSWTVTGTNDAPVVSGAVTLDAIAEDSGARTITQAELLANASDVDDNASLTATGLTISAGSGVLVDNHDGTWTYTPAHDDDTSVSFSYTVTDGSLNAVASATLDITPVNDAPVNAVPSAQSVDEDTTLVFSTANGNAISISDVDAGAGTEQVTLSVAHGSLTLAQITGLTFTTGDGTGDATMTFTGTVSDINAALNGLSYQGNLNYNGGDSLSIVTGDQGHTGSGGPLSDSDNVGITVNAVNDAPAGTNGTVTATEDTPYTFTAADFGFTDPVDAASLSGANALAAVKITTLPGNGVLTDNGEVVAEGQSISVSDITSGLLKFLPFPDDNGVAYASFTFQVQDDGDTAHGGVDLDPSPNTITIDVTAVNDAPVASGSATLAAIDEDTASPAGATVSSLFGGNFSDATDNVPGGSSANAFAGIAISSYTPDAAKGAWEYSNDNGVTWTALGAATAAAAITLLATDKLHFVPAQDYNGAATALSANLIESSADTITSGAIVNLTGATGGTTHISTGTVALGETINPVNDAPVAVNDTASLDESVASSVTGNLLANDTDIDTAHNQLFVSYLVNDPAQQHLYSDGTYGQLDVDPTTGAYTYTLWTDVAGANQQQLDAVHAMGAGSVHIEDFAYRVSDGSLESDSATLAITVTGKNDAPTGSVTISGTAQENETLTASNNIADADGLGTIAYQWQRDGSNISGANGTTYQLTSGDVGHTIDVVAKYTDGGGTNESVTSSATATVTAANAAPVVDLNGAAAGGNSSTTALNDGSVFGQIFGPAASIVDTDNTTLHSASISVALDGNGSYQTYLDDQLTVETGALPGGADSGSTVFAGSWNGITWETMSGGSGLFMNLSGDASLADYETLLSHVHFSTSSSDLTDRIATLTVNDGIDDSAPVTSTIHVGNVVDWTAMGGGDWSEALNWTQASNPNLHTVPVSTDDVIISDGCGPVSVNVAASVNQLTVDLGTNVVAVEHLTVAGHLANSGNLEADSGGVIDLNGTVDNYNIGDVGHLTVNGGVINVAAAATNDAYFGNAGGTLNLADAAEFTGTIHGFSSGDTLTFGNYMIAGGYGYVNGVLDVMLSADGNPQNAQDVLFHFDGNYSLGNFVQTQDAHGLQYNNMTPVIGDLSVVSGPPTDGWTYNSDTGHWYMAVDDLQSWAGAKTAAENMGGYLATVTSQTENDFLFNLVHDAGLGDVWLGASDDATQGTTEGHWIWAVGPEAGQEFWQGASDGTPSGFANWNGGEPNNATFDGNDPATGENYAIMWGTDSAANGTWNDMLGDNPQWYAVEWNGIALDGTIAFTDPGSGDTHGANVTPVGQSDANLFSLTPTVTEPNGATPGSVAWHFDMTSDQFDQLDSAGQVVTQSYNVAISDNYGATATQQISVTVGTNGNDNFVFNANDHLGADTIANFSTASDMIELDGFGFLAVNNNDPQNTNDVWHAITQDAAGNAVINLGTADASNQPDTITIAGVSQSLLQQHLDQFVHLGPLA